MTDAHDKSVAASVEPQQEEPLKPIAVEELYPTNQMFVGGRSFHRDPSYPLGHARNPVPPVPLPDHDWAKRLARRYNFKVAGE
jgi:hypothetical protein